MSTGTIPLAQAIPNQLITSALWNAEFGNVQALTTPPGITDYSTTDAEMQIETDPYPGSVTSKATSLAGELERIRFQLAQLINGGTDFWYKLPASNIAAVNNALVPLGGIIIFYGTPGANFVICNGQAISRTTYSGLYSLVANLWGAGDGTTTFNVPDLRDRFVIGAQGSISGVIGTTGGAATQTPVDAGHTHTSPTHSHDLQNHTHPGGSHTHSLEVAVSTVLSGSAPVYTSNAPYYDSIDPNRQLSIDPPVPGAGFTAQTVGADTSGATGDTGVPSSNATSANAVTVNSGTANIGSISTLPPYMGLVFIIRVL